MFDKLDMATFIDIESVEFEKLLKEKSNIKQFTNIDNDTGEIHNTYIIYDEKLSYIKYNDRNKRLFFSLSIPKLLYGNNIHEIDEQDIKEFFNIIHTRFKELFNISIDHEAWKINEVEVSKNFRLDSQQQVTEYINKLSNIKLPRKTTIKYNSQTVYFKNKSQIIKFYDKLQELKKDKDIDHELLKQAENILRFEVHAKGYLLREFSAERKAIDILTTEFFDSVSSEVIEMINNKIAPNNESIITPIIFDSGLTRNQVESSVAIMIFTNEWGEATVREIYPYSTLKTKQDKLRDLMQFVQQRQGTEQKPFLKL